MKEWKLSKLKFEVDLISEKIHFGEVDARYIGLEHIESSTGRLLDSSESSPDGLVSQFEDGDVLFGKLRPYLAKVASPDFSGVCSSEALVLRPRKKTDRKFLQYRLLEPGFIDAVNASTFGAKMPRASWSFIGNQQIDIPLKVTQTQIADFLDRETSRIDRLIEKKRQQIDLLREKEKSEISEIANRGMGQTDFSTDNEFPWRGKFPSRWKESRLRAHFRQAKRQGFEDLEVLSVYREFGVIEKSSRTDNNNKTPEDLSKYQLVEPGDLVINKMKAWQGSLGVSRFRGIVSPDYVVMVPIREHHPEYMHHLLRAKPMPNVYEQISKGIRLAQWRLEPYKFLCLPLFLPEIEEQKEISIAIDRALKRSRATQRAIRKSISLLMEKRAALITAAVAGQLDVNLNIATLASANDNVPVLVAVEIIRTHQRSKRFGRVKFQKIVYLAEAHCGIHEFAGNYLREAAGPLDRTLLDHLERELAGAQLYRAEQSDDGGAVFYTALTRANDDRSELTRALGHRAEKFTTMLNRLRDLDTHSVEAVTTLYAVWNDHLIDGKTPNDQDIIFGVLEDWHPEKKDKFRKDELNNWLGWMRRNDFIPEGQGPKTTTGRLFV